MWPLFPQIAFELKVDEISARIFFYKMFKWVSLKRKMWNVHFLELKYVELVFFFPFSLAFSVHFIGIWRAVLSARFHLINLCPFAFCISNDFIVIGWLRWSSKSGYINVYLTGKMGRNLSWMYILELIWM